MADTTIYQGGLTGTSPYNGMAYALDVQTRKEIALLSKRKCTLLDMIKTRGANFNTAQELGTKVTLDVWMNTLPANESSAGYGAYYGADSSNTVDSLVNAVEGRALTHTGQLTPQRIMMGDGKQAEFPFAEYTSVIGISERELRQYAKGSDSQRMSFIQGRARQNADDFMRKFQYDLCTQTTAGSASKVMSLGYLVSTTNVVGGIDPASTTRWASTVDTGGAWDEVTFSKMLKDLDLFKDANTDLIVFSASSGSQLNFEKFEQIYSSKVLLDQSDTQELGAKKLIYKGAVVTYDSYLPDNNVFFLDTSQIFFNGDLDAKDIDGNQRVRLPQTTVSLQHFQAIICMSGYPNYQGKWTAAVA